LHDGQDSIVLGPIEQGLEMSPHYRWKVVSQLCIYLKMEGVLRPGIEVKVILRQPQHILCSWWYN